MSMLEHLWRLEVVTLVIMSVCFTLNLVYFGSLFAFPQVARKKTCSFALVFWHVLNMLKWVSNSLILLTHFGSGGFQLSCALSEGASHVDAWASGLWTFGGCTLGIAWPCHGCQGWRIVRKGAGLKDRIATKHFHNTEMTSKTQPGLLLGIMASRRAMSSMCKFVSLLCFRSIQGGRPWNSTW